ncbi:MAG: UbiD family decarboxylase domain-containing protein [Gammaproteobacteria bacterium]
MEPTDPTPRLDRRELLTAAAGLAAAAGLTGVAPPAAAARRVSSPAWPYDSFRDYIQALEDHGLLLRVPRLDQDRYEMTALTYRLIDEFGWQGAPALLAEEVRQDGRWMQGPVVTNHQGHWDTEAIIWGREPVAGHPIETYRGMLGHCTDLITRGGGKLPVIPPRPLQAAAAPVKEIVLRGDQVNLLDFAFLKSNPGDSGRYINTGSVFTSDPELGQNFGTYRCEIKGPRRLGVNSEENQTGWKMLTKKIERGEKRCPVSIVLGQDPLTWVVSSSPLSKGGADELAIAGGLRGKAVDVVKCETNDFLVPAHAEIVIEGDILLDQLEPEGPFGEMYGYLGAKKERNFVMDVTCVTHRRKPWVLNHYTGVTRGYCTAPLEAFAFYRIRKAIPDAVAFHSPVGLTGYGFLAIDKKRPGHGLELGKQLTAIMGRNKICVVVDRDVDVLNEEEVLQAVGARWQPYPASAITPEAKGNPLDPSLRKRPLSSNIVIDATKQWPEEGGPSIYPERNRDLLTRLAPDSWQLVDGNWDRYLKYWKRNS